MVGWLKFVEGDLRFRDAEAGQHFAARGNHLRRTAEIKLDGPEVRVRLEILFPDNFVDEAAMLGPVVLRQRDGQREVKAEVWEFGREACKIILIKNFLPGSRAIPAGWTERS